MKISREDFDQIMRLPEHRQPDAYFSLCTVFEAMVHSDYTFKSAIRRGATVEQATSEANKNLPDAFEHHLWEIKELQLANTPMGDSINHLWFELEQFDKYTPPNFTEGSTTDDH